MSSVLIGVAVGVIVTLIAVGVCYLHVAAETDEETHGWDARCDG